MSTYYSVFIKTKISLESLAKTLGGIIGIPLKECFSETSQIYRASVLGLAIDLMAAEKYVDDREIKLSQFDYYIGVDFPRHDLDNSYASEWHRMSAVIIGNMLSRNLSCECIVLKNVQVLLAHFIPDRMDEL